MGNSKYFYCYSYKLMCFLKSYGFRYVFKGKNSNSKSTYYAFKKSVDLDNVIILWNTIKYKLKEHKE
ncbi:hypothetical protein C823_007620 [Eubacterium plexicaudatum ASF492]|uniref:DUF5659 domain-containing protein n=1 Tax=Eubacterium plexicaudatum ASF492 TaxID=1235802 RepID=N2A5R7_9FIRM|nr:hypothetical protein C823_007620 [Eubacterium plexicaudatum ASF492]